MTRRLGMGADSNKGVVAQLWLVPVGRLCAAAQIRRIALGQNFPTDDADKPTLRTYGRVITHALASLPSAPSRTRAG